jgi:hypothetical protein
LSHTSFQIVDQPAAATPRRFFSLPKMALAVLCLMPPAWLHAETISGTVEDPSGAVIAP